MWASGRGIAELDMFAERLPRWQKNSLHFSCPAYSESDEQPRPWHAQALCLRLAQPFASLFLDRTTG